MPLDLSQYKGYMSDAISREVVDMIASGKTGSALALSRLPFTSNARLAPGDLAWTYRFYRRTQQRALDVRQVNNDYTASEVTAPVAVTVDLSIFGGSFEYDRVMSDAGDVVDLVEENFGALALAVPPKFWDLAINGDASTPGEYDGLDIALTGTTTEYNASAHVALDTASNIETNWKQFRYDFRKFLASLKRRPDAFLVNSDFKPVFAEIAQYAGAYAITADDFGREVETYNGIPFHDLGERDGDTTAIIPTETRDYGSGNVTGLTDIYAICYGPQEFHGVAPSEKSRLVQTYVPRPNEPGAVRKGELEVVATTALEHTKAAGVFRNLKVA